MPMDPPRHAVSHRLRIDGLSLHCIEYPGDGPPLVLLHSLTGNARIFDGLILAGLADHFRVLVPEMCGRGQSETAFTQLSLADGLRHLLAWLDHFGIGSAALCGHSFGGLAALYATDRAPARVSHLALLDAAADMHPAAPALAAMAAIRLDGLYPSVQAYRDAVVRPASFSQPWHAAMQGFVEADLAPVAPGIYTTAARSGTAHIASLHVQSMAQREWRDCAARVQVPALLAQAAEPFWMGIPMLTDDGAGTTARLLRAPRVRIPGNHFTMLYGAGAERIVQALAPWSGQGTAEPAAAMTV
ncbi:alpha/beta fold hydrolase [Paracidovorax citrulli]|uniref:Alpha/beta hydrolase fold protein n=2 Tax=Paracidovorax citrulli TaxID=80869 RepID=A1TUB9_PARC0|nr:alpha/beta hydrolase fold protein [Paracidovorax citrulli AAC00-1]ATG94009.1 alpha/beta hydrolase [Paracidovorax citrulli]MVT28070.1 alpha/beta fold hydrolase [Paracidovorax citrulli]MVT37282.1 alpha/beta fold hydrolase [Paracidovorax citrulli]QCX09968.1 2-succinyl-6-hydroxy-2, 4-cyclohexadiene-1-carboxylate synthase [Paracidovorax citrulli]